MNNIKSGLALRMGQPAFCYKGMLCEYFSEKF